MIRQEKKFQPTDIFHQFQQCKNFTKKSERAYRDGFHANLGTARYMLGLVWYMTLLGKSDIEAVNYSEFDVAVSDGKRKSLSSAHFMPCMEISIDKKSRQNQPTLRLLDLPRFC